MQRVVTGRNSKQIIKLWRNLIKFRPPNERRHRHVTPRHTLIHLTTAHIFLSTPRAAQPDKSFNPPKKGVICPVSPRHSRQRPTCGALPDRAQSRFVPRRRRGNAGLTTVPYHSYYPVSHTPPRVPVPTVPFCLL